MTDHLSDDDERRYLELNPIKTAQPSLSDETLDGLLTKIGLGGLAGRSKNVITLHGLENQSIDGEIAPQFLFTPDPACKSAWMNISFQSLSMMVDIRNNPATGLYQVDEASVQLIPEGYDDMTAPAINIGCASGDADEEKYLKRFFETFSAAVVDIALKTPDTELPAFQKALYIIENVLAIKVRKDLHASDLAVNRLVKNMKLDPQ